MKLTPRCQGFWMRRPDKEWIKIGAVGKTSVKGITESGSVVVFRRNEKEIDWVKKPKVKGGA